MKLASEMGREQGDTLFVFDEPTIGLHPLDVIRNADYIINMEPSGGIDGEKDYI